jgi:hypothetical protein
MGKFSQERYANAASTSLYKKIQKKAKVMKNSSDNPHKKLLSRSMTI